MTRHRRTDPACRQHREPRTWWQRRRHDRARGYSCPVCMPAPPPLPPDRAPSGPAGDSGARPTLGTPRYHTHRTRNTQALMLLLGLIPECQPVIRSVQTYTDRGTPEPEVTAYLLTCQTCASELLNDQPGRLVHVTDTEHQVQPDLDRPARTHPHAPR